jgi:putative DNA primase/helicase
VPRRCVEGLRDPSRPLWWTEGTKKVDALASLGLVAVNTPGVDGWRSPSAIADLYGIPLKGRDVVLAYDSDVLTNLNVRRALEALAAWMKQKGAEISVVDWSRALPETPR